MDRMDAWLLIYSGIVSFQNHPRNLKPKGPEECARLTDEYIREYATRKMAWDTIKQQRQSSED